MSFSTYFSKQAKRPSGLFGRFFMSRVFEKGNAELHALVLETLAIKENEHVLEIGFGTGLLLRQIADSLERGFIEGIDFSELMVAMALKKNKRHINAGKVKIHSGDFAEVRFNDSSFDKVFSINTIYFWQRPDATVSKIYRLLKPGGKFFIGFHEKSEMEKAALDRDIFQYYCLNDITQLLSTSGPFDNVDIISKKGKQKTCFCAAGTKPK
jgi:ubiquinone/menaquinone biosynthesis C-methylase UbiE